MAVDKIQSSQGGLQLFLSPVPKLMRRMKEEWLTPSSMMVSFKLETSDLAFLLYKAYEGGILKYGVDLVVFNYPPC